MCSQWKPLSYRRAHFHLRRSRHRPRHDHSGLSYTQDRSRGLI
jgi:hypothetical protein